MHPNAHFVNNPSRKDSCQACINCTSSHEQETPHYDTPTNRNTISVLRYAGHHLSYPIMDISDPIPIVQGLILWLIVCAFILFLAVIGMKLLSEDDDNNKKKQ